MNHGSSPVDLEEVFFAKKNARLLEKLRQQEERDQRRDTLRKIVKIQDDSFLDRLIALGIGPERAMVLRLIPLISVAWADGSVDARERQAILDAAAEQGMAAEEMAQECLGDWLDRKPDDRLLDMWKEYISTVWPRFTRDEQIQMRTNILSATRQVAESAGGFLGIASISTAEKVVLDELDQILS